MFFISNRRILKEIVFMTAATDHLAASVASLTAAVAQHATDLQAVVDQMRATSDSSVVENAANQIDAAVAKLNSAVAPVATPQPVPVDAPASPIASVP